MKKTILPLLAILLFTVPSFAAEKYLRLDDYVPPLPQSSGSGDMTKAVYDVADDGSADTANALKANGANCAAGQYPLGVDAAGAVETCTADVNTNANTLCAGSTTYLDGDGNCDDISATYASISNLGADPVVCSTGDVVGTNCGVGLDMRLEPVIHLDTGTVELMAVTQGRACFVCTTAAVCHLDPNAADRFVLSGTALADGDKLSSDGTIGARICFYKDSANGWSTMGNPDGHWADGN